MKLPYRLKRPWFKTRCIYCTQPIISKSTRAVVYMIGVAVAIFYVHILLVGFPVYKLWWVAQSIETTAETELIAQQILQTCSNMTDWERCEASFVMQFVMVNVTYKKDELLEEYLLMDNGPKETLEKGGDCENQAILMISILKSIGSKERTYLVSQENSISGHICVMVTHQMKGTSTYYNQFYNCDGSRITAILAIT